jgi:hypothetical protein
MYYCAAHGHEQTEPCRDCAAQDAGPDVFLTWDWETFGPKVRKGILSASVVDPHDGGTSEHYIPAARAAAMRAELEEMRGPRDQWGRMRAERDAANARALAAEQRLVDMAEVPCTNEWAGIGLAKALACTEADRCSFCRVRALRGGGSP